MVILLLVSGLILLLLIRVPVAFALIIPSLTYIAFTDRIAFGAALPRMTVGVESFLLVAVPLFVLLGNLANEAKISDRLYGLAETLLGHVRGSLGYANVLASFVFSWMNGVAMADLAGLSKVEVPAMLRAGYPKGFSIGITGASSMIGPVMPPSVPAVLYAVSAGVSLGGMLLAGVVPAVVVAVVLGIYVYIRVGRDDRLRKPRASLRSVVRGISAGALPMLTPVILIGGILGGVFTPTESAAVAVLYVVVLGVVYRSLSLRNLYRALASTCVTTGGVLFIVAGATLFGWVLAMERLPQMLADFVLSTTDSPVLFLIGVNVLLLVVGTFLDLGSAILILIPVLGPVSLELGIDPLHFGVVVIFNLMIGGLTPPVGVLTYVLSAALNEPFNVVMRAIVPFLVPLGFLLLLLTFVPVLSIWLPHAAGLGR